MSTDTTTKTTSTNWKATTNRVAKAKRLSNYVVQNQSLFAPARAVDFSETTWKLVNEILGEKKKTVSDLTIAMAVAFATDAGC